MSRKLLCISLMAFCLFLSQLWAETQKQEVLLRVLHPVTHFVENPQIMFTRDGAPVVTTPECKDHGFYKYSLEPGTYAVSCGKISSSLFVLPGVNMIVDLTDNPQSKDKESTREITEMGGLLLYPLKGTRDPAVWLAAIPGQRDIWSLHAYDHLSRKEILNTLCFVYDLDISVIGRRYDRLQALDANGWSADNVIKWQDLDQAVLMEIRQRKIALLDVLPDLLVAEDDKPGGSNSFLSVNTSRILLDINKGNIDKMYVSYMNTADKQPVLVFKKKTTEIK